jgi:hypothetical protein
VAQTASPRFARELCRPCRPLLLRPLSNARSQAADGKEGAGEPGQRPVPTGYSWPRPPRALRALHGVARLPSALALP